MMENMTIFGLIKIDYQTWGRLYLQPQVMIKRKKQSQLSISVTFYYMINLRHVLQKKLKKGSDVINNKQELELTANHVEVTLSTRTCDGACRNQTSVN